MSDNDSTGTATQMATTDNGFTAPYTSFSTVLRLIERMAEEGGAPSRMDRSYLSNLPGGAQTVFIASCKTLGLIDEDMHPTQTLEALIDASPDDRKGLIGELVRKHYTGPLSLGARATQAQLEEEFRKLNVSGSTMRKAVGFYLNALKFAGIAYSPNFKLPKVTSNGSRPKRKSATEKEPEKPAGEGGGDEGAEVRGDLPTLVKGLIERLPADGETWSASEADQWLKIAGLTFPFVYGYEGDGDS
jgi:hypothetical protein